MPPRKPPRRGRNTNRDYPRTLRLNRLLHQIVADELERVDDERLDLLTIVSVAVEADLRHALVYYDHLDGDAGDDEALAALGEARIQLQAAIAAQARIKRVPELTFEPDPAIRAGARIDALLREIQPLDEAERAEGEPAGVDHAAVETAAVERPGGADKPAAVERPGGADKPAAVERPEGADTVDPAT